MMDDGRRCLTITILTALLGLADPALAAEPEVEAATLARDAEKLMADGKVGEACTKLAESVDLDPRSATALELGRCRDKQGRVGSAYRAYALAEKLAKKENRADRVASARNKKNRLYFKIARLTVKVDDETKKLDGLVIRVGDEVLPADEYGESWPANAGKVTIEASAPGYETHTEEISLSERQKKTVSIPALKEAPEEAEPAGAPPAPKPEEEPGEEPADEPEDEPEEPATEGADEHEDGRLVVEIGGMGGFLYSDISQGSLSDLAGLAYTYPKTADTVEQASCGNTDLIPGAGDCEAFFESAIGATAGGQIFIGWAFTPRFHLGIRGFGQVRFPEGFLLGGGPALSGRVAGPLWIGASFLVGTETHRADLERATGSVPPELRELNGGQDTVEIPRDSLPFDDGEVGAGLLLGGNLEISLALLGASPHALLSVGEPRGFFSGSLMLSVWPTMMALDNGFILAVPGGLSYRFH